MGVSDVFYGYYLWLVKLSGGLFVRGEEDSSPPEGVCFEGVGKDYQGWMGRLVRFVGYHPGVV